MIYTVTLNPARDRSVSIENFAAGKVNRVLELRDDPGGKGINVSKIIKVLGGESTAMGILGGGTGEYIENAVRELGIKTDFVKTEKETRTNIKISDPVNHVTTDINEKGEILKADAQRVLERLESVVKPGDICVIAGKLDLKAVSPEEWITKLSAAGAKVFLDTEGDALKAGVKAGPYLVKPNDTELMQLLGREAKGEDEIINAARRLIADYGVNTVAVSRGKDGALFVTGEAVYACPGIKVTEVSSVGAGDTMMGALAYGIERGDSIEDTYRLSVAASAAAVTCPGTKSPEKPVIDELLTRARINRLQ